MKEVRTEVLTLREANEQLGVDMDAKFWEALVRLIAYPELMWDARSETIRFPSYVPFAVLGKEWIDGIEHGIYDVRECAVCGEYYDVNQTDGIFGNPTDFEEYICLPCADRISAREYYERFVTRER